MAEGGCTLETPNEGSGLRLQGGTAVHEGNWVGQIEKKRMRPPMVPGLAFFHAGENLSARKKEFMRPRQKCQVTVASRPQTQKEATEFRQALRGFLFELARRELRANRRDDHGSHFRQHCQAD